MDHTWEVRFHSLAASVLVLVMSSYAAEAQEQELSSAGQKAVKQPAATIVGSIADAEDAIIHILMINERSPTAKIGRGTGFFISPTGYLLTAAHNLNSGEPGARPFAYTKDNKVVPLSVLRIDTELDVAVLFAPISTRKYFALSDNALVRWESGRRLEASQIPIPNKGAFHLYPFDGLVFQLWILSRWVRLG